MTQWDVIIDHDIMLRVISGNNFSQLATNFYSCSYSQQNFSAWLEIVFAVIFQGFVQMYYEVLSGSQWNVM